MLGAKCFHTTCEHAWIHIWCWPQTISENLRTHLNEHLMQAPNNFHKICESVCHRCDIAWDAGPKQFHCMQQQLQHTSMTTIPHAYQYHWFTLAHTKYLLYPSTKQWVLLPMHTNALVYTPHLPPYITNHNELHVYITTYLTYTVYVHAGSWVFGLIWINKLMNVCIYNVCTHVCV